MGPPPGGSMYSPLLEWMHTPLPPPLDLMPAPPGLPLEIPSDMLSLGMMCPEGLETRSPLGDFRAAMIPPAPVLPFSYNTPRMTPPASSSPISSCNPALGGRLGGTGGVAGDGDGGGGMGMNYPFLGIVHTHPHVDSHPSAPYFLPPPQAKRN